jgi:CRP/FNR family transcriptional regulator, cyclic AMP receptor protein
MFRGLRSHDLRRISELLQLSRLPAGWRLMKQGQGGHEAFILVNGTAVVSIDGREIARLGPGETVGEMALLGAAPRSATVTAATDVEVLVMSSRTFDELLAIPGVAAAVIRTMAARLRAVEGVPAH